jgi:hypothetical protein
MQLTAKVATNLVPGQEKKPAQFLTAAGRRRPAEPMMAQGLHKEWQRDGGDL